MKELGTTERHALLARAGGPTTPGQNPWPTGQRPVNNPPSTDAHDDFTRLVDHAATPDSGRPLGIERRLVRRAEALWTQMAGKHPMPAATQLPAILQPPYGPCAALFRVYPEKTPRSLGISFVGERLLAEGLLEPGPVPPSVDPADPVAHQCAGMALAAARTRRPAHYDSESLGTGIRVAPNRPAVMMRAVALPFRPSRAEPLPAAIPVIVVLSWRQILSESDAQALQREFAAAIAWIRNSPTDAH